MTYHYTPSGHPTGQASINVLDLQPEFHPTGADAWRCFVDGPIDAPDLLAYGGVRYRQSPVDQTPHPAFQTHIIHREH